MDIKIIITIFVEKLKPIPMTSYNVIYLKSTSKSFDWNNGLFAIYKSDNATVHLWKIKEGKLSYYDDGVTPNISCTSINNTDMIPTNMIIFK